MKKESTKQDAPQKNTEDIVTTRAEIIKNLITTKMASVTIHYQGNDYTYARTNGAVQITPEEIDTMPEGLALLIVLLSGARKLYLPPEAYCGIKDGIWFHLDRQSGGLKAEAEELFSDDEAVLAAAAAHRQVHEKKTAQK